MQGARGRGRWCCRTPGSEPHDFTLAHEEIRNLCEAICLAASRLFIQRAAVVVNWASAAARRPQNDGRGSQKCNSRSRIDLLRFRKPMEPILTVCPIAVEY